MDSSSIFLPLPLREVAPERWEAIDALPLPLERVLFLPPLVVFDLLSSPSSKSWIFDFAGADALPFLPFFGDGSSSRTGSSSFSSSSLMTSWVAGISDFLLRPLLDFVGAGLIEDSLASSSTWDNRDARDPILARPPLLPLPLPLLEATLFLSAPVTTFAREALL